MKTIYLIIGLLNLVTVISSTSLPSYLNICSRSDPNIDECIWNSIEKLRPKLVDGIPILHVPRLEPLLVPLIKVDQKVGPIYVKSKFKNVEIMGTSKFVIKDVKINFDENIFGLKMNFPALNITSDYSVSGKILIMPINGHGIFKANFTDVTVTCVMQGDRYLKNTTNGEEEEFLNVSDIFVNFTIGGSETHLNNLFNGELKLATRMNAFLNANWRIIAHEVRPVLEDAMSELFKEITDEFFTVFSYDQLFPIK